MLNSRNRRSHSRVLLGSLSAVMIVGVAANGAIAATPAPKPATGTNNASCAPQPGVTPTTINFGFISPRTGAAASNFVAGQEAAALRFAQENAKGGVNGRKIIMKAYDDGSNASTQVAVAQQAVQADNNFALGSDTSTVSMYPFLKDANIPIFGFTNQAFQTDRNAMSPVGVPSPPGIGSLLILQKLKALGVTKIAVINHATAGAAASGNTQSGQVTAGLIPGLTQSLRIADEPQGTHDATSTALRIKNSGTDGASVIGFTDGAVSISQALKQQGVNLKAVYYGSITDPAVLNTTNGALDGAWGNNNGTVPLSLSSIPAVRTYVNGMKAAGQNAYAAFGTVGYLDADLFIQGLKMVGKCPTRQGLIDAVRSIKDFKGAGLLPEKIDFTPGLTPNGNPPSCIWFVQVSGKTTVPDKAPTCGATYVDLTGKVVYQGHN